MEFRLTGILPSNAVVTQLGECKTEDLEVAGSSPAHGTIFLSSDDGRQPGDKLMSQDALERNVQEVFVCP